MDELDAGEVEAAFRDLWRVGPVGERRRSRQHWPDSPDWAHP
jgi:hypothetical protein